MSANPKVKPESSAQQKTTSAPASNGAEVPPAIPSPPPPAPAIRATPAAHPESKLPTAPATFYEITAWVIAAAILLFVFQFHFVSMLLPALLVHGLIKMLTGMLKGQGLSQSRAKVLSLFIVGAAAISVATLVVLGVFALMTGKVGNLPNLFKDLAKTVDSARTWMEPHGGAKLIPEEYADADMLREKLSEWLSTHGEELKRVGIEELRNLFHAVIGIILGALVSFEAGDPEGPLGRALDERVRRFASAFDKIVFAQIKISTLNTSLTALYLMIILPLFGVSLDHRFTLVCITFIAGLLPVVGNLISNTIIVVLSIKASPSAGVASLIYLIVIHKLEYFLNARIVGGEIHAAAWEILLAMLCFEAAFGLPGLIMAPIIYAYVKQELADRRLL